MGNYRIKVTPFKMMVKLFFKTVLRRIKSVPNDANSVLCDGLVEIEDGVGHQRVGGQLGGGQPGVR